VPTDSYIRYDDANSGSGQGDIAFFIPVSYFAGAKQTDYVYMYQRWGTNLQADTMTQGGFEETAIYRITAVPEVSSFAPLAGVLGMVVGVHPLPPPPDREGRVKQLVFSKSPLLARQRVFFCCTAIPHITPPLCHPERSGGGKAGGAQSKDPVALATRSAVAKNALARCSQRNLPGPSTGSLDSAPRRLRPPQRSAQDDGPG
jgi:hypothetical protein